MQVIEEHSCFSGIQGVYSHQAKSTKCSMNFAVFLPPQAKKNAVPVLYWLSGLTCTEQNFITKAGAQRLAAELGLAIVAVDTSPRNVHPVAENDLGEGASFYIDATKEPWRAHYQMAHYIGQELPALIGQHFPVDQQRMGIFGHSMGGHGALTLACKNPQQYRSVSAFAPICSLIESPWGQNALTHYLGTDRQQWQNYDACTLLKNKGWGNSAILVDQGKADPFLKEQLKPHLLKEACQQAGVKLQLREHQSYDHSYYFIASFIDDHLRFHANYLS